jgi:DNA-damage-inducible protein J
MDSTNVTLRLDKNLKNDFEQTLDVMGLNLNSAFVILAKYVVRTQSFPVPLSADIPNDLTAKTIEDALNGVGLSEPMSWEEAKKEILSGK